MSEVDVSKKYIDALSDLLGGTLQPAEFEVWFWTTYKDEPAGMSTYVFAILDRLCDDVDAYCSNADVRDELSLDEKGLIQSAKNALRALKCCPQAGQ
jgi:hypothetical protein